MWYFHCVLDYPRAQQVIKSIFPTWQKLFPLTFPAKESPLQLKSLLQLEKLKAFYFPPGAIFLCPSVIQPITSYRNFYRLWEPAFLLPPHFHNTGFYITVPRLNIHYFALLNTFVNAHYCQLAVGVAISARGGLSAGSWEAPREKQRFAGRVVLRCWCFCPGSTSSAQTGRGILLPPLHTSFTIGLPRPNTGDGGNTAPTHRQLLSLVPKFSCRIRLG